MVRRRRKKAFYEVIGKTWPKSGYGRTMERLHPEKSAEVEPISAGSGLPIRERLSQWPKRPKIVQLNSGRIEFSVPYQIAIAVLMGLILLLLVAFRFGQASRNKQSISALDAQPAVGTDKAGSKLANLSAVTADKSPLTADKPELQALHKATAIPTTVITDADNVIVLVQYHKRADLVPVQKHFAGYGIETEIIRQSIGNNIRYFLITGNKYKNPEKSGTDGYKAKQRIIEVGAKYKGKAPEGYETFAPHFFADAYGRKVE